MMLVAEAGKPITANDDDDDDGNDGIMESDTSTLPA